GLETYIQRDIVHDEASFKQWLELFLNEQLSFADGLTMRLIYDALNHQNTEKILYLDKILFVQNLPKETRQGSKQMRNRMVKLPTELYDSEWLKWYKTKNNNKNAKLHPAICFTMPGHHLGVDIEMIIDYYLYQNVSSLTQNAVRAIPLGQTAGQRIVHDMIPFMKNKKKNNYTLKESQLGITAPGLEINQMEHENVNVRII